MPKEKNIESANQKEAFMGEEHFDERWQDVQWWCV
jgi:hypothetical protein